MSDDFMRRFRRASWDPIILATSVGLRLVDLLLAGSIANRSWNALCALQARRYRAILPR
jgi:hypothetical protein